MPLYTENELRALLSDTGKTHFVCNAKLWVSEAVWYKPSTWRDGYYVREAFEVESQDCVANWGEAQQWANLRGR